MALKEEKKPSPKRVFLDQFVKLHRTSKEMRIRVDVIEKQLKEEERLVGELERSKEFRRQVKFADEGVFGS